MADKKVSELTAITNLTTDDLIMVVNDPAGTASSRKVTVGNLFGNVAVITKHTSNTTFTANTTFNGTTMTVSANLVLGGSNVTDSINDRYQVANAQSDLANTNTWVATKANSAFVTSNYVANTQYQAFITSTGVQANSNIVRVGSNHGLRVPNQSNTPATSNAVTEGLSVGTIFYSNTHLYIVTDSNTIKRVNLSTF